MPPLYVSIHLLLTSTCFCVALLAPRNWSLFLRLLTFALVITGFAVERWPPMAWGSMEWGFRDLVFFSNVSLEGVAVLLALTWRDIYSNGGWFSYMRGILLSGFLLSGTWWSYAWFFEPLPPVHGRIQPDGFLFQTTDDSCGAAAAAMLLHAYGIESTEEEMAELCLTRAGRGTSPAGLFRGLAVKGAEKGLCPRLITLRPGEFHRLGQPAIIGVGLRADAPPSVTARMESYGWRPGFRHAVIVFGGSPDGNWVEVGDPEQGRETWPVQHVQYLWDDRALVMVRE